MSNIKYLMVFPLPFKTQKRNIEKSLPVVNDLEQVRHFMVKTTDLYIIFVREIKASNVGGI